jgi:SPP1 family predicted phage head-tail adaptor
MVSKFTKYGLSPADYKNRVNFQLPVETKTGGVSSTSWITTITNVYANIENIRSFDQTNNQTVYAGADVKIRIRYRPGISARMRVVDESGQIYSILGQPENYKRENREIILTCQSGVKAQ